MWLSKQQYYMAGEQETALGGELGAAGKLERQRRVYCAAHDDSTRADGEPLAGDGASDRSRNCR